MNPTQNQPDVTSKVILTNVQVLAAGTKIEQDEKNKPVQVAVVTLLVNPDEAEKLTLASTEADSARPSQSARQDRARDLRHQARRADGHRSSGPQRSTASTARPRPQQPRSTPAYRPTVEIIRGDKRSQEVVAQVARCV